MPLSSPAYQYSIISISCTTSLVTPASSRASRTAAVSRLSPFSTIPLGSCHLFCPPTETITTSAFPLLPRNTTPPAETCSLTGNLLAGVFFDGDSLDFRGVIFPPRVRNDRATPGPSPARDWCRFAPFSPDGSPSRSDNPPRDHRTHR